MARTAFVDVENETVLVHGRPTSLRWLMNKVLNWFGPYGEPVNTNLPCAAPGCKGNLIHVHELAWVRDVPHKVVFTKTNVNRRVSTKVHDSCSVPSCPNWGEFVMVALEEDDKLAKQAKKRMRAWRYR